MCNTVRNETRDLYIKKIDGLFVEKQLKLAFPTQLGAAPSAIPYLSLRKFAK